MNKQQLLPNEFPTLLKFQSNKEYVREILESQIDLTANLDQYVDVKELDKDHRFHVYQKAANRDPVPSSEVIKKRIDKEKEDYRFVSEGEHPVKALQDRKSVDEDVARK